MTVSATITVQTAATVTQNKLGNFTGRPQVYHYRQLTSVDVTKCYPASVSPNLTLDVTALTDPYGNALVFSTVLAIQVLNNDGTNSVTVSGNLIGTDKVTVGPGKCLFIDTTRTVDGTHKQLTLTKSGGSPTCDVILLGT